MIEREPDPPVLQWIVSALDTRSGGLLRFRRVRLHGRVADHARPEPVASEPRDRLIRAD
jgi:predicted O-methyltransferase YrrM